MMALTACWLLLLVFMINMTNQRESTDMPEKQITLHLAGLPEHGPVAFNNACNEDQAIIAWKHKHLSTGMCRLSGYTRVCCHFLLDLTVSAHVEVNTSVLSPVGGALSLVWHGPSSWYTMFLWDLKPSWETRWSLLIRLQAFLPELMPGNMTSSLISFVWEKCNVSGS